MRMARQQDIGAAEADIVEIGRPVFQDNDWQAFVAVSQKLLDRFPASGSPVIPADQVKSVVDLFDSVLKEANSGLIEKRLRAGAVQIMISGNPVDAVFGLQAAELGFELPQLLALPVAFEHVTSDQNDIRVDSIDLFYEPLHQIAVGGLPEIKIGGKGDFQLPDTRRFLRNFNRVLSDLRVIILHRTHHDDGYGHRQNQKKPRPTESLASYSFLGQDSSQSGHAESEILQDDEQDEIQQEWQRKIAGGYNKIGPSHTRRMSQGLGKRESQHDKTIDDNEKDFEKPLRDQLPDAKPNIDYQRQAK